MKKLLALLALALLASLFVSSINCGGDDDDDDNAGDDEEGDDDDDACPDPTLDIAVCDPANGPFSLTIDNEFFPLVVGTQSVLEGEDDEGVTIRVEIDVLDETEDVAGVTARVVTETEYEDGELVEVSRNWFAQAPDGTVCYFGEGVTHYEDGEPMPGEDAWRAGEDGAQAGIIMPGDPQIGDAYYQEYDEGVAEDMGSITAFGEEIDVPAGVFDDTMTVTDYNALEGCEPETKYYVRGIGLAIDEDAELISY